ncbi:MAG TPA: M20 family metallopeptidase [Thermomicrobiaceae bacterium]|nr:M20 family metallopeptidase [Thermomicrobiaceae bacterium]
MASREELRQRIVDAIEANRERIIAVGEEIRLNPEIGYEEVKASQLLASAIRDHGYEVEKPAGGLETAFVAAKHGRAEGPVVAVLAEYDALPGIGHGCGHNLIAASGLAAAIGMNAVMDELSGIFEVIGTPAEESGGGKIQLIDAGVFADVDASLMVHHGGNHTDAASDYPHGRSLAVAHVDYEFFGKPAHAAGDPWNGNNAVNAVVALFNGIDALRQHIHMESRIHGIITHGGDAPNVVPKYAAAKFFIRAETMEYMQELVDKVAKIAEGAAMMTGCELKITEGEVCYDMRPSYVVGGRYKEHMRAMGLEIAPRPTGRKASTDFGNVSYLMPAITGRFAISHEPIPGHSQQVVDASGSDYGYDQLIKVSKAMALTAFDLLTEPELLASAKEEHTRWGTGELG